MSPRTTVPSSPRPPQQLPPAEGAGVQRRNANEEESFTVFVYIYVFVFWKYDFLNKFQAKSNYLSQLVFLFLEHLLHLMADAQRDGNLDLVIRVVEESCSDLSEEILVSSGLLLVPEHGLSVELGIIDVVQLALEGL